MWLSLLLSLVVAPGPTDTARPNMLIVVADDVAERDIDGIPTPHFDGLAASGMRFRRAYANPTCSPARWSLTFGQYHALDAGLACLGGSAERAPDPDQASLPRLLSGAGYRCALFGKWHLGFNPEARRVDSESASWKSAAQVHGYGTWRAGMAANVNSCGGRSYDNWQRVDDGSVARSRDYNTQAILDAVLDWLPVAQSEEQPWFAMVCFQAPHGPFHVPPGQVESPSAGDESTSHRAQYELMMRSFDEALGRILERVDLTRTLVLVVGDNGTPDAVPGPDQTAGRLKGSTFEDGIRVPMVWAGPGVARGRESEALVHFVDVLPTLAEMAGSALDAPSAELHGMSITRTLLDPSLAAHARVWCGLAPTEADRPAQFAVVTPRFKYMKVGKRRSLFDLLQDPRERRNLAERSGFERTCRELDAFLESHRPAPGYRATLRGPKAKEAAKGGRKGRKG